MRAQDGGVCNGRVRVGSMKIKIWENWKWKVALGK